MLTKLSKEEMIKGFVCDYTKIKDAFKEMLSENGFRWNKDSDKRHFLGREGVWFSYALHVTIRVRWGKASPRAIMYVDSDFLDTVRKFFDSYEIVDHMEYPNFDYDILNTVALPRVKKTEEKIEEKSEKKIEEKSEKKGKKLSKKKKGKKLSKKKKVTKIVITKRTDDYHACIAGHPEIWGCGENYSQAIGDLIRSHREEFNVDIEYDTPKYRYGFCIVKCANCGFQKFTGVFAGYDLLEQLNHTSACCKKPNYDM